MIMLVLALFGWSWYVHVIVMDADLLTDGALQVARRVKTRMETRETAY